MSQKYYKSDHSRQEGGEEGLWTAAQVHEKMEIMQMVRRWARLVHELSYERLMGGIRLASIKAK